jgi:hypothetical protein
MEIRSIIHINQDDIDKLFENSDSYWFHHTEQWRTYSLNMRDCGSKDLSFGVFQDNELVAFSPLVKEFIFNSRDKDEFSMAGLPSVFPMFSGNLSTNNKEKIEKFAFKYIFELAKKEDIRYMNFYVSPLNCMLLNKKIVVNPLPKLGFDDTTVTTNILALGQDDEVLFRSFRKGTKSDIKTAVKNDIKVRIYKSSDITKEVFNLYRDIHFQASGRQTRPDKTWDIMFEWIQQGLSLLAIVTKDEDYIAAQFINVYAHKAYYHSGATLPSHERERGVGHLAQWEVIKFLNSSGVTHYDLGMNLYPNLSQDVADAKSLGISRFKSGFGANIHPFFRGEWFRDKEFMMDVYKSRMDDLFAARSY